MSDVIMVSKDGLRYGADTGRSDSVRDRASRRDGASTAAGRQIEDVVDLKAGLRSAKDLAAMSPKEMADALADGQAKVRDNAAKFGALLSGGKSTSFVDKVWNAVSKVVSEILSGPHPGKTPDARRNVAERVAAELAPPPPAKDGAA